jgi:hypothetical protein
MIDDAKVIKKRGSSANVLSNAKNIPINAKRGVKLRTIPSTGLFSSCNGDAVDFRQGAAIAARADPLEDKFG